VRADLEFVPIETMDQVLGIALERPVGTPAVATPPAPAPPPDDTQPAHYTH
jgi:hypothetical protein